MAERLLVTQALDERDLLVKKIKDKINAASFVDVKKNNEERGYDSRLSMEEFSRKAQSAYQQIMDLIDRFQKIDAAIVASNAMNQVQTSYGSMSVAAAISLRNRLRERGGYFGDGDFEGLLRDHMAQQYSHCISVKEDKNRQLNLTAEEMRLSILGKDSKVRDDKPLDVVETYVRQNTTELMDPLGIIARMEALMEKKDTLLRELDTAIKVSNATSFIEI